MNRAGMVALRKGLDDGGGAGAKDQYGKRAAILDAAILEFSERGFDGATMDGIAVRANVSKRTVYLHFDSKDFLFGAIIKRMQASLQAELDPVIHEPHDDPRTTLRQLAAATVDVVLRPDAITLYRVVVAESRRAPQLGVAFHRNGAQRSIAALAKYLKAQHERGTLHVRNPQIAAEQFYGMVVSHIRAVMLHGIQSEVSRAQAARWVHHAVELFLGGVESKPGRGGKAAEAPTSASRRAMRNTR